jgi:hypothetical protein
MKQIHINESQRKRLFEAFQESFSFEELSKLGDGISLGEDNSVLQFQYCARMLGKPDSMGSSRTVFTLSDNHILKLAYGKKYLAGIEQNEAEWNLFQDIDSPLLVKVLYHDRNFTYLVSESVLPAEPVDFEKILGIPYRDTWVQHTMPSRHFQDSTVGYDKYFDDLKEYDEEYNGICVYDLLNYIHIKYTNKYNKLYKSEYEEFINNHPWFKELKRLALYSTIADYISIGNFGVVNRDGNPTIVILDSGFNENIWMKYYAQ